MNSFTQLKPDLSFFFFFSSWCHPTHRRSRNTWKAGRVPLFSECPGFLLSLCCPRARKPWHSKHPSLNNVFLFWASYLKHLNLFFFCRRQHYVSLKSYTFKKLKYALLEITCCLVSLKVLNLLAYLMYFLNAASFPEKFPYQTLPHSNNNHVFLMRSLKLRTSKKCFHLFHKHFLTVS